METATPLLTILGVLPLVGSLLGFVVRGRAGKQLAMVFALATLVFGVVVFFIAGTTDLSETVSWISPIGAWYALSLDGMGRVMVLLTVILVPIVLLAEWRIDEDETPAQAAPRWQGNVFAAFALMLEGFALFVFMSADVLLFYIFFEATLVPMFFLIQGWGGERRGRAAMKFLLYSLAGGLIMLFAVVGVYAVTADAGQPSFLVSDVAALGIGGTTGRLLFVGFFVAFAVKAPMVPVHTWLPDTAEQATPGSSTLLVGILDKIGTFGMIRLCLGLFPEASQWATPLVVVLAVISIVYGAIMAISSTNLLRLVAYTSVSHFGYMVLGIFAFTTASVSGSIFYMLAHGFSSAALFLVVGFLLRRRGTVEISAFGGIQKLVPLLAGVFLVSGLATLGLPGTANFVGEFSIMTGSWPRQMVAVIFAVAGTVLAAVYVLWAYQRVFAGPVNPEAAEHVTRDLDLRERTVVAPLIALLLVFGFFPQPIIDVVAPTAQATMTQVGLTDPEPGSMGGK
ncbi:NADH-quinone oxidoreductase subunit M [Brooklawnia cerclae]|uniref:NADH-quinone oxidoreductase subunit M n=1 Tax=Brooklawnia cerclae TaxID=349934 RepID=A0ABX0SGD8_9ACTN|nr:NADH-quinone oxidoreductase subunit M [Brooklawnia cerclae]NIH55791.1 NADH-quinone oxidoreductase subunit M [Brooklawnia cerclae]